LDLELFGLHPLLLPLYILNEGFLIFFSEDLAIWENIPSEGDSLSPLSFVFYPPLRDELTFFIEDEGVVCPSKWELESDYEILARVLMLVYAFVFNLRLR